MMGDIMELKKYLFFKRVNVKEFSEKLEISRSYLSAIVNGKIIPSKKIARQIERATQGEVTVEDILKGKEAKSNR